MMLNELLKDRAAPVYFVYLTNGENRFPKAANTISDIFNNLREEAPMGYKDLWLLKRIGLITGDQVSYYTENDVLSSEDTKQLNQAHPYLTYRFVRLNAGISSKYSPHEAIVSHVDWEEAAHYAAEEIKKSKKKYPERDFLVLIGRLIETMNWH